MIPLPSTDWLISPGGSTPNTTSPLYTAYATALRIEAIPATAMYGRVLGFLLKEWPTRDGQHRIAVEINSCTGETPDKDCILLAKLYVNYVIKSFKVNSYKGEKSENPSRSSFDDDHRDKLLQLITCSNDYSASKKLALYRDNFHCLVGPTLVNLNSVRINAQLQKAGDNVRELQAAHIFPQHLAKQFSRDDKSNDHAASVWAVMERLGNLFYAKEFGDPHIIIDKKDKKDKKDPTGPTGTLHRLENILILSGDVHTLFDKLSLWLEPLPLDLGRPNAYYVRTEYPESNYPKVVEFTSHDQDEHGNLLKFKDEKLAPTIPLPSRRYLELHAACCRIAHLSGAGEYIDKHLRDMESKQVLSGDGRDAELFNTALFGLSSVAVA